MNTHITNIKGDWQEVVERYKDCIVPPDFYCAEGKRKENDE